MVIENDFNDLIAFFQSRRARKGDLNRGLRLGAVANILGK